MSILDELEEAVYEFETRTGRKPTELNVPSWREPELAEAAKSWGHTGGKIIEFCGMQVNYWRLNHIEYR